MLMGILKGIFQPKATQVLSKTSSIQDAVAIGQLWQNAMACKQRGEGFAAVQELQVLLERDPNHVQALHEMGQLLQMLGKSTAAQLAFEHLLKLRPDDAHALLGMGVVMHGMERYEEALMWAEKSLQLEPQNHQAQINKIEALTELGRCAEAMECLDQAYPDLANTLEAKTCRIKVLIKQMRHDDALRMGEQLLQKYPRAWKVHLNMGIVHWHFLRLSQAKACYQKALAFKPDYRSAQENLGMLELLEGRYEMGWPLYENRHKAQWFRVPGWTTPQWTGQAFKPGERIYVHAEQGLGDTLQFIRYVPMLAERGAKVLLQIQPALRKLLSDLPGVHAWLTERPAASEMDWHSPLLSLPFAMSTRLDNIPDRLPYVHADALRIKHTRSWLPATGKFKVGVVWAGNPKQGADMHRSMPLQELEPLWQVDVQWISLQKDLRPGDEQLLQQVHITPVGLRLNDFSDTAAVIEQLDLVISVCTSVAHLSAAMGKPTWVMLQYTSDFRWLLDRDDSPWYPGVVRLFRQDASRQWSPVVRRVRQALEKMLQEKR